MRAGAAHSAVTGASLRPRIATGIVLGALVVAAVTGLQTPVLAAVFAVVVLLGAWEWSALAGCAGPVFRAGYVFATALLLAGLGAVHGAPFLALQAAACGWWVLAALWIAGVQHGRIVRRPGPAVLVPLGWLVLLPGWAALVELHGAGPRWVVLLLVLICAADTGAWATGRRWGRRRLADRVSPGKSWEGAAGGLAATLVVALLAAAWLGLSAAATAGLLVLAVATGAFSVVGDLLESLVKRHAGVKDSGTLLPGHGGILDRIDSITAAAPWFALGLATLEIRA